MKTILPILILLPLLTGTTRAATLSVPADHARIQDALKAAKPGDTVRVDAGRYTGRITIPDGVTVLSQGDATKGKHGLARAEATVLDGGGKAPAVVLGAGATLDGFTVTGAGSFDEGTFKKHWEERGENLPDNMGAVGVDSGGASIWIEDATATVTHCIVRDNGFPGIGVSGEGNASVISHNRVFRNMGGGIGIADGARAHVTENRCWENLRAGIGCRNASPLIEKNHCFENVRAGIGIREGATPRVTDNDCYRNQRAGIGVRMRGTAPVLEGNRCEENGMAGIGSRDGAAPFILRNVCRGNRLAGIGARNNAQPVIVGNRIEGNEAAAIGLAACESGTALILDNDILPKKLVGIGIQAGWTVTAESNRISRAGGLPPLVMVFEGARAEFQGNRFIGSGVAAIRSQGQLFVSNNRFECPAPRKGGPPQTAVWALPGSMLSMTDDNVIEGWRVPDNPAVRVTNRDELEAALGNAVPGTTILLAPGEYRGGVSMRDLKGEPSRPIVIAGSHQARPPLFKGGQSGLHLIRPAYVELRQLNIAGAQVNGINIDDGGDPGQPAHDLVLSRLVVRDVGGKGNRDGIKLSGLKDFRVENCHVARWGSGGSGIDMVGCHDGVVSDSRFEHQPDAHGANGVQTKGGSSHIEVRRCRFTNAGGRSINAGGSTGGDYFRPRDARAEARDIIVEDCRFSGSDAPVAFVGVDGAVFRFNTIHRPSRWIARILQENRDGRLTKCRNGVFARNLVAFRSGELRTALNVGPDTQPETFRIDGNIWICLDRPGESGALIRLPSTAAGGIDATELPRWVGKDGDGYPAPPGAGIRWIRGED